MPPARHLLEADCEDDVEKIYGELTPSSSSAFSFGRDFLEPSFPKELENV